MKKPTVKQAAIYYHVPPESKINDTQIANEINHIKDMCHQCGWKPVHTFIDKSVTGSMRDIMRAFVADPNNHISATLCYTAGDCLVGVSSKNCTQSLGQRANTAETVKYTGGVPYGYTIDSSGFMVDHDKAAVVVTIFQAKAVGDSLSTIANTLNNNGIRSSRGGEWSKAAIAFILKNPAYTGQYRINGNTVVIPAIIDSQLYHKANA